MVTIDEESCESDAKMKLPDKFKLTSKWVVFAESIDTYLNRLKGQGRIPLNYVIWIEAESKIGAVYATEQELLVATIPIDSDLYNLDNKRIYAIIKKLILEGPGWSYINTLIILLIEQRMDTLYGWHLRPIVKVKAI
jgi:hypothetical protein